VSLSTNTLQSSLRRIAAVAAFLALPLALAPTASAATRLVAPGGSDSSDCLAVPCASLSRAYSQAAAGDVVTIAPGSYPSQTVPFATKAVTFVGQPGNKIRQLNNHASNVTYTGLDIDAEFTTPNGAALENHGEPGGVNVTFKNMRVGNVTDQKGALFGGWSSTASQHLVIDNVEFHDVLHRGEGVHNECVFSQSPGLTIRNSTFRNCATMDISINRGSWWGQPPYGGVTLENNVFGHSVMDEDGWHHYGLAWFIGAFENARVVNNTFENAVLIDENNIGSGPYSGVWANNIGGGWECLPGVTYRNNVGKKCDGSDRAVSPSSSCGPPACASVRTMPVGWINPAGFDFSLAPNSPAISAANPAYATATDKRGLPRDSKPDAGAFEFGVGGAGGPPASGEGGARWKLRFAALRPRVICRRPRRGCPATTKLRLRLGRPARMTVRIQRLRKGAKPKRVRSLAMRKLKIHKARRIRARGLAAGRYRVVVGATDAAGRRSAPVRLKLRVR
jgi:hypothetical protein